RIKTTPTTTNAVRANRWLGNGAVPDRCKMGPRWKAAKIAATPISIWNTWISSCFINSSQGTHDAGEYFCTLTRTGSIDIFELYQQFKLQSHGWHSCCGMRGILRCNYNHERSGANHVANTGRYWIFVGFLVSRRAEHRDSCAKARQGAFAGSASS